MRDAVRGLAARCTVCVVSGRDRPVVQAADGCRRSGGRGQPRLRHLEPEGGAIEHEAAAGSEELLERVTARLREELDSIEGALVEPKKASVAAHYRLVSDGGAARGRGGRGAAARGSSRGAEGHAREDGLRAPTEARLGQGQGRALPLGRARPRRATTSCRSTSGTTSPTSTPSRRWPGRGSASSSAAPTTRRWAAGHRRRLRARLHRGGGAIPGHARTLTAPRGGCTRQDSTLAYDSFEPGRGGAARGAHLDRQRLLLHPRRGRVGGRRRRPLPRHLRPRRLQPRDDDHGRPPGPERGPREPAQLARPEAADRGRGADRPRQRRAALLPPRARHPQRDGGARRCASGIEPAARPRSAAGAS